MAILLLFIVWTRERGNFSNVTGVERDNKRKGNPRDQSKFSRLIGSPFSVHASFGRGGLPFKKPPIPSGLQAISWALGCCQDVYLDFRKEIYNDLQAQSEFYLNQGFVNEIEKVAQRIDVDELGTCSIAHCMRMLTTGHLMAEVYNRQILLWQILESNFPPINHLPNNNPPIFLGLTETQHFVVLKMKDEDLFPTPQLEKNWEHCHPRGNSVEK
ncbi:hypothetical protein VP01_2868g6 [Puccinia sorghi]|uniref:OTU domain-containing protein n=1 Tax=Puccinia sorghi TaxID=27349 RepID=A0A0L6V3N1_9BASI|nr:hypothetical protein VP01_2868g6 [Puccinia sorghi]